MKPQVVYTPPIKMLTAQGAARVKCPRCQQRIEGGERYVEHSTDGAVHAGCLRIATRKEFIGKSNGARGRP